MKLLIYSILFILFLGCSMPYKVKNGQKYVLIEKLNLNPKERFMLKYKTHSDSPFVIYNHRTGKYYYSTTWDYSQITKIGRK